MSYIKFLLLILSIFCFEVNGKAIVPYIIGGHNATDGDAPWQVAIRDDQEKELCGGSIISDQWIVTGANCMAQFSSR